MLREALSAEMGWLKLIMNVVGGNEATETETKAV
jgi:hypothetical protein